MEYARRPRAAPASSPSNAASSTLGSSGCCRQVKWFHRVQAAFLRTTDDETSRPTASSWSGKGSAATSSPTMPFRSSRACGPPGGRRRWSTRWRYLFRFLDHHGLLRVGGSPQWYSVAGGSRVYVERLAGLLPGRARGRHAVTDVTRREGGVEIRDVTGRVTPRGPRSHRDPRHQALGLLTDPADAEVTTLKAFGYSSNVTVLHTDSSVLPVGTERRASWKHRMTFLRPGRRGRRGDLLDEPASGHQSPEAFLVTLNDGERLDPGSVAAVMHYEHPTYTADAVRAQARLGGLATDRTVMPGPTTAGASTRTAAAPASRPPGTSG